MEIFGNKLENHWSQLSLVNLIYLESRLYIINEKQRVVEEYKDKIYSQLGWLRLF